MRRFMNTVGDVGTISTGRSRTPVALLAEGIVVSIHYIPLHLHLPFWRLLLQPAIKQDAE